MSASRPGRHLGQPFAGDESTAERSSTLTTWSEVRSGMVASSVAAAALTWGVAKLVPSASWYSPGPQDE